MKKIKTFEELYQQLQTIFNFVHSEHHYINDILINGRIYMEGFFEITYSDEDKRVEVKVNNTTTRCSFTSAFNLIIKTHKDYFFIPRYFDETSTVQMGSIIRCNSELIKQPGLLYKLA